MSATDKPVSTSSPPATSSASTEAKPVVASDVKKMNELKNVRNPATTISSPTNSFLNPSKGTPHRLDLFDAAVTSPKPPDRTLLMPFSQLVEELTNYEKQQVDPNTGYAMTIAQLTVDMPIELKVTVNHDGKVNLKGSPPTQLVKTTVMPVFHQMRLTVVREDGDE